MAWDVFISHASEDKAAVAEPLAASLETLGLKVWLDNRVLRIGDSLREKIDEGLAQSRFGIVVISPSFMKKEWPKKELDGLMQREADGRKVILPVWHQVTRTIVVKYSPILASRLAGSTDIGIEKLAHQLLDAISGDERSVDSAQPVEPIAVKISFNEANIRPDQHRYFLALHLSVSNPPARSGIRLRMKWPYRIKIISAVGFKKTGGERIGDRDYYKYSCNFKQTIYPGEEVDLLGAESDNRLMYCVDDKSFGCIGCGDMVLYWSLFFADQLPISGEVNFRDLNVF